MTAVEDYAFSIHCSKCKKDIPVYLSDYADKMRIVQGNKKTEFVFECIKCEPEIVIAGKQMDVMLFTCVLCTTKHASTTKDKYGLHITPTTITTSRNKAGEWYYHCVQCSRDINDDPIRRLK